MTIDEINVRQAQLRLNHAKRRWERITESAQRGATSPQEVEDAELELQLLDLELERVKAAQRGN